MRIAGGADEQFLEVKVRDKQNAGILFVAAWRNDRRQLEIPGSPVPGREILSKPVPLNPCNSRRHPAGIVPGGAAHTEVG
jgi:hypothetical protein